MQHLSRAYERLLELKSKQQTSTCAGRCLAKLETAAPALAGASRGARRVCDHFGSGRPPRDAASAWTWRPSQRLPRPAGRVSRSKALQTRENLLEQFAGETSS